MEKKIGEKIKIGETVLIVKESEKANCDHCYFYIKCRKYMFEVVSNIVGECSSITRRDRKSVVFVKVDK